MAIGRGVLAATVNIRTQHVDRATLSADSDGLVRRRALEHQRECAQDAERCHLGCYDDEQVSIWNPESEISDLRIHDKAASDEAALFVK